MVSPIIIKHSDGFGHFYWNVDANVGVGSPNRTEDVQLVQLGYAIMAKSTNPLIPASDKAVFALVKVGAPCTGLESDPLVQAIRKHQASRGGAQDGHVSVLPPAGIDYPHRGGTKGFMLASIMGNIRDAMPTDYPRIDKHASCPAALKASVIKGCTI